MYSERFAAIPGVGRAARLLGGAGLLPQLATLVLQAQNAGTEAGKIAAFGYGSLILSFIGGMWWGFAMRRTERQQALVIAAIIPSLVPLALAPVAVLAGWRWALVGLAVALVLTLLVDARLVERGDAPEGWMGLRVPLSGGLAALTLIAAVMR
jgi:peptidoglycan/LPS O-acetylase OafA/YrhL